MKKRISLRMRGSLRQSLFLGLFCFSMVSHAGSRDEDPPSLAATSAATRSTAEALSAAIGSSFLGGGTVFRMQIGHTDDPAVMSGEKLRGMAASEPSPWSIWATPVYTRVDNRIAPLLSEGSVKLLLAGIEYSRNDRFIVGLSVTGDKAAITSIERPQVGVESRSQVTGKGYTLGPYFVAVLSPSWMFDLSSGVGENKLESVASSGTRSEPKDERSFIAAGLTHMRPLTSRVIFTGKFGLSYSEDEISAFSVRSLNGSVSSNAGSLTKLTQSRLGGQFSYQAGALTPFVGAYVVANDFVVTTSSALKPKEYKTTAQGVLGLNFSQGPVYGAVVYQAERDRGQVRVYAGIRY